MFLTMLSPDSNVVSIEGEVWPVHFAWDHHSPHFNITTMEEHLVRNNGYVLSRYLQHYLVSARRYPLFFCDGRMQPDPAVHFTFLLQRAC
mmetsp:Transcript_20223/g.28998  ORF Transcript_20223/g.28998 Transcript_20223/m.28998 type:complete len:90 (+) Transcript_20223:65-334(+)